MVQILVPVLESHKGGNSMRFCPKCGKEIVDESLGCPVCDMAKKQEQTKSVNSFVVQDDKGTC